jgi:hypothetical protein
MASTKKELLQVYIAPQVVTKIRELMVRHKRNKSAQVEQMLEDAIRSEGK